MPGNTAIRYPFCPQIWILWSAFSKGQRRHVARGLLRGRRQVAVGAAAGWWGDMSVSRRVGRVGGGNHCVRGASEGPRLCFRTMSTAGWGRSGENVSFCLWFWMLFLVCHVIAVLWFTRSELLKSDFTFFLLREGFVSGSWVGYCPLWVFVRHCNKGSRQFFSQNVTL